MLKEINTIKEFQNKVKNNDFCVVGFYSPTCLECSKLAPLFKKGAKQYPKICFLRINFADAKNKKLIELNKIMSPTLLLFKKGKEYKRFRVEFEPLDKIKKEFLDFLKSSVKEQ